MVVTNDPALISSVGDSGDGASDNAEKEGEFAEKERANSSAEPLRLPVRPRLQVKTCSPQIRCFCFLGMIGDFSRNEVDHCGV